jgi:prepilin-type N-terminal cleavage/methylation domain-containing protein
MGSVCLNKTHGFSLIEMMIALLLLTLGLLAAGQLIYSTVSTGSLARSKMTAAIAAQDEIERLSALYARNPLANDLTIGDHGPLRSDFSNPLEGTALNRYSILWNISEVPDPRPGKTINAKIARITIIPQSGQTRFNKIINVTTVLSPKTL